MTAPQAWARGPQAHSSSPDMSTCSLVGRSARAAPSPCSQPDDVSSAGMNGDRHDVLPQGERIPDHSSYTAEGVDSYYNQSSFQPQNNQETAQYYAGGQGIGDGRYSPQSSFSAPSEQAHSAAGPQHAAPARRKPSQRQRSGNLSMLRVHMLYNLL